MDAALFFSLSAINLRPSFPSAFTDGVCEHVGYHAFSASPSQLESNQRSNAVNSADHYRAVKPTLCSSRH
jgi:hypothetical protein